MGITGGAADAVLDPLKTLRWSCLKCKKRNIDFHKLFMETRNGFSEICKEIATLCGKFEKLEMMFDECHYLNHSSAPSTFKR